MPTPRPIMVARVAVSSGTSLTAASRPTRPVPTARAKTPSPIGSTIAVTEPTRDEQHDHRQQKADVLVACRLPVAEVGDRAADLDLQTTPNRRRDSVSNGIEVGRGQFIESNRIVDRREGGAAVSAEGAGLQRIGDPGDIVEFTGAVDRFADSGCQRRVIEPSDVRVEHDAARGSREPGEALFDQIDRTLRLRSRDVEGVDRVAAPLCPRGDDYDGDGEPDKSTRRGRRAATVPRS